MPWKRINGQIRQQFAGPQTDHFELASCDDPRCGVHMLSYDEEGRCLSETVIAAEDMVEFAERLKDMAYAKAAERDE
jgi:hypothetical protein